MYVVQGMMCMSSRYLYVYVYPSRVCRVQCPQTPSPSKQPPFPCVVKGRRIFLPPPRPDEIVFPNRSVQTSEIATFGVNPTTTARRGEDEGGRGRMIMAET